MDTFSAASSILSLLESVSSVIHSLVKLADGEEQSYQMRRWITKADVCKYLLYGLGNQFTQSAWAPSKDITDVKKSCLLLCGDAFKTLSDRLAKMEDSKLKAFKSAPQVERALDDGLAAIRMLREIIDQGQSHEIFRRLAELDYLIRESRDFQQRRLKQVQDELLGLSQIGSPNIQVKLEELAKRVGSESAHIGQAEGIRPEPSDPFTITATIMRSHQAESEHTVVRAHLDSGCRDDWISQKVVERAGLREQLRPVENFGAFIGFGGQVLEPRHVIDVTWFAKNATVSRTTSFLVHEHVPFDMVLGKVFIRKESIFMLNEPALALRQGDFTQEELQEIEVEARRKKATSEQITSVREARGAAARDRLRQQKAASRLASTSQLLIAPGTTGSRSSTDVSMLSRRHVAQAQSFSSRNQSQEVVAGTIGSEPRLDRDRLRTSAVTDFESPRTGNEGNSTEAAKWAR